MTTPLPQFSSRSLYDIYLVKLQVREHLCGGKPKDPSVLETHIKVKTGFDDTITKAQIAEALENIPATAEDVEVEISKVSNGFATDQHGLFLHAINLKAMFKESCSMLDIFRRRLGSKQILQHGFEIKLPPHLMEQYGVTSNDRIYLGRDKPDGFLENIVHASTPKGKVTSIKRMDYVSGVTLEFEIWVLASHPSERRHLSEETILGMLVFSQENGLGADRSQGRGKHDILSFAAVSKGSNPYGKSVDNEETKEAKPASGRKAKGKKSEEVAASEDPDDAKAAE